MCFFHDTKYKQWGESGGVLPYNTKQARPSSYDLTLGPKIKVQLFDTVVPEWMPRILGDIIRYFIPDKYVGWSNETEVEGFVLEPGGFVLSHTNEWVNMPDDCIGFISLRSSYAREGLNHSFSGLVDAGFKGQLTLELGNMSAAPIILKPGNIIAQICIGKQIDKSLAPYGSSGVGNYQGQLGPTEADVRSLNHEYKEWK